MKKIITIICLLTIYLNASAAHFGKKATYCVCFTPGGNCTQLIVNEIASASESIKIQMYQFEDPDIIAAVVKAKERDIDIQIVLDKTQINTAQYFSSQNIPVWIDNKPAISHNKILLIDSDISGIGSFNFSKNAEKRNAENWTFITDRNFYRVYFKNFEKRRNDSKKYNHIDWKTKNAS